MVMPLGNEEKPQIIPWATFLLVLLNLVGFGLELGKPSSFAVAYAVTPYEITHGTDIHRPFRYLVEPGSAANASSTVEANGYLVHQAAGPSPIWLTLFTALFLHADSIHLAGNMLFLFIFGQKIEEAFGRALFLAFYVGCGVVGTLIQVAITPESLSPTLGASGAIAGIMGAYLVWFPRDRVRVLFFNLLILIPAYAVIGSWIALQVIKGIFLTGSTAEQSNIAYVAHIGGATAGIVISAMLYFGKLWLDRMKQRRLPNQSSFPRSPLENEAFPSRGALPEMTELQE